MSTDQHRIRDDLQGVRGLAVLGVVVYHLRASWLPGGYAGVDVFFVLSGFFITGLLLRELDRGRRIDLVRFWSRRARRLLPVSVLVLVTTVLAARALTNPLETHRVARDGLFAAVFDMNWREASSGLAYGQDPNPSPFQHYWSLGVEEQFYLVWPVVLTLLVAVPLWRRTGWTPGRTTVVVLGPLLGVASFALALHQTGIDQPHAYYGTFGRVWELAVGAVLAATAGHRHIAVTRASPDAAGAALRTAGVVIVLGFYAAGPDAADYPGWWSLLPVLGTTLVVAAGAPASRRDPITWLLTGRAGQLGGRYSYSWYLWHWAPLVLLPIVLDRPLRVPELAACALGSLVVAVVTFHLVEDPLRRSRWLSAPRRARSLGLAVGLLVVALATAQWTSSAAERTATHSHVVTADHHVLLPTPAAAAQEEPVASADGCQLSLTSPALAPDCRYRPDVGHGDVVLVGDSHAGMWLPAVEQVARQEQWGLRVWTRVSCPFADVRKTVSAGGEYHVCDRWRADVIRRLIAARPSLVIVSSYAQDGLHVDDPRTGRGAGQLQAHQLLRDGMQRNLGRLRAAGLHVLVIRDVPSFATSGPDCALTHPADLAACSRPQAQALPFGGVDAAAARAVRGVHVVDLSDAFCRAEVCHQVVGDTLAYRDLNHLTARMALNLEPRIRAAALAAAR